MNPYRERQNLQAPGQFGQTTGGYHPGTIVVRNISGADVPRYGVLQLKEPSFAVSDDELSTFSVSNIWDGEATETDPIAPNCGFGWFCVTLHEIAANSSGLAVMGGLVHCKIDYTAGDWDWADIGDDNNCLCTHPAGAATILWAADDPDDDGLYNGIVRLSIGSNSGVVSGTASSGSTNGGTGTLTPSQPSGAQDVTYTNSLGTVANGDRLIVSWVRQERKFFLVSDGCE